VKKILVDADASPVREIVVNVARRRDIPVLLVANHHHRIESDYACVLIVDDAADAADYVLVEHAEHDDVVVTADFGLAAMALAKSARVLTPWGERLTEHNIDNKLALRHVHRVNRRRGIYTKSSKRRRQDDDLFRRALVDLLEEIHGLSREI
jgi:uncharacterized protein YaiI (UPF0178 family)